MPLTAAARALAIRHGITATSTSERLAAVCSAGVIDPALRDQLDEVRSRLQGWLLHQQIVDLEAGRTPNKQIDIASLSPIERQSLRASLAQIRELPAIVQAGLA